MSDEASKPGQDEVGKATGQEDKVVEPQPGSEEASRTELFKKTALEIDEATDSMEAVKAVEDLLIISRDSSERLRVYIDGYHKAVELGDATLAAQFLAGQQMERRLADLTETLTQFMNRLKTQ